MLVSRPQTPKSQIEGDDFVPRSVGPRNRYLQAVRIFTKECV